MVTFQFPWDPYDPKNPGPCIKFSISRFLQEIEDGKRIGFEYADPPAPTALIDTGSPFTIINRVLARSFNLALTNPTFQIYTLSGPCICEEYCGSISFPGSRLPRIPTVRILARDLPKETAYACIIGRNVLKRWDIRFDGPKRTVSITA